MGYERLKELAGLVAKKYDRIKGFKATHKNRARHLSQGERLVMCPVQDISEMSGVPVDALLSAKQNESHRRAEILRTVA